MMVSQGRLALSFVVLLLAAGLVHAQAAKPFTSFRFATVEEGRAVMKERDEYIRRLSPLERALKAKSEAPVSEADFLQLLADSVKPWTDAERATLLTALESVRAPLDELPLPETVVLVRTTGAGQGNAPHTRGNAIVFTDLPLRQPQNLAGLVTHEAFHIASRHDRAWRDAMYATIGFVAIEEVTLPPQLAARRITNPDAPRIDVAIKVQADSGAAWVTPILQSTIDRYDAARGGEFFSYLTLIWLEVARGESAPWSANLSDSPRLLLTAALRGFVEQVGRNTAYIIHPEEILADNFTQLATGKTGPSPEVHQRLREALKARAPVRR